MNNIVKPLIIVLIIAAIATFLTFFCCEKVDTGAYVEGVPTEQTTTKH